MKRFEYKFYKGIADESSLNKFGLEGWELVHYSHDNRCIFKREMRNLIEKDLEILNEQFSEEVTLEKIKK